MAIFAKTNQHPAMAWTFYVLCIAFFGFLSAILLLLFGIDGAWPQRTATVVGGFIGGFVWKGLAGWPWDRARLK